MAIKRTRNDSDEEDNIVSSSGYTHLCRYGLLRHGDQEIVCENAPLFSLVLLYLSWTRVSAEI